MSSEFLTPKRVISLIVLPSILLRAWLLFAWLPYRRAVLFAFLFCAATWLKIAPPAVADGKMPATATWANNACGQREFMAGNGYARAIGSRSPVSALPLIAQIGDSPDKFDYRSRTFYVPKWVQAVCAYSPQADDAGYVFLDLESGGGRGIFEDVWDAQGKSLQGTPRYNDAVRKVSEVIDAIHAARPHVKVGHYMGYWDWSLLGPELLEKFDFYLREAYFYVNPYTSPATDQSKMWMYHLTKSRLQNTLDCAERYHKEAFALVTPHVAGYGNRPVVALQDQDPVLAAIMEARGKGGKKVDGIAVWAILYENNYRVVSETQPYIDLASHAADVMESYCTHSYSLFPPGNQAGKG